MSYLLDTGVWMWALDSFEHLRPAAREILTNGREEIFLSAATTWELTFKMTLGKLKFTSPPTLSVPRLMTQQNLKLLAVTHAHATRVYDLPLHHGDPFDRLLIAQALAENLPILTADREFKKYHVPLLWCGR